MAPLVVISILNWNGWQETIRCLESVYAQDYPDFLTVVVDNGSSDGSPDRIRAWAIDHFGRGEVVAEYDEQAALAGGHPEEEDRLDAVPGQKRLVLIRSRENLGWAGGNNLAAAYSLRRRKVRYVFFLNNDVIVDRRALSTLVETGSPFPKAILAAVPQTAAGNGGSPRLSLAFVRFLFSPLLNPGRHVPGAQALCESDCVCGAAMLVSRGVVEDVLRLEGECFSSKIFLHWEDFLFSHLAAQRGSVVGNVPDAVVWHKVSASSGGTRGPLVFYYRERGKILAANAALPLPARTLFHLVNPLLCLARAMKYFVVRPACAQAALCGFVDGIRGVGGKWRHHDRFTNVPVPTPILFVKDR